MMMARELIATDRGRSVSRRGLSACVDAHAEVALGRRLVVMWLAAMVVLMLAAFGWTASVRADEGERSAAEDAEFFEKHVRPLLAEHCYSCHGPDKQRGELRLDSLAGVLTGGESGPAIEPSRPEDSLLVSAIRYESYEMPPAGQLPEQQIAILEEWVRLGAPWPGSEADAPAVRTTRGEITDEDRAYWAYQPVQPTPPPELEAPWIQTPVDAFILAGQQQHGLEPAPAADRLALARRAYFDLWGLPPTPEQVDQFLADERPDAFRHLVDQLLDHPNYGRRWARHWLDLVRFAESDGYKQDTFRPEAWRYRDYVIRSFNDDKPYDQFVMEQLAGDEIAPHDPEAIIATAFLRHTIYEYNQRDVRSQWEYMVNELTDVTADVFLGVGLGCARCHDHKFDPILQRDYFRFRAFFEPILPRDDLRLGTAEQVAEYERKMEQWRERTAEIRAELDELERPIREKLATAAIEKFPKDVRPMMRRSQDDRDPHEHQIAELANRQVVEEMAKVSDQLKGVEKERWEELQAALADFDELRPEPIPPAFRVSDVGSSAPPTYIPGHSASEPIEPGFLSVLDPSPAEITPPPSGLDSTGRRTALARWISSDDNPLATRVIVNRIWQYHFGEGLVRSSSDFGRLGDPPTHPELLDWLARYFLEEGRSIKQMHRLIMNSATYQQSTRGSDPERAMLADPENRYLWRMTTRRLDAEQIRDALLAVSAALVPRGEGPSADSSEPVRTIFTKVIRNRRDPLLDAFDWPDSFGSTSKRNVTTTPTQALLLINSQKMLQHAGAFAEHLREQSFSASEDMIDYAYRRAFSRPATTDEIAEARQFLVAQTALHQPAAQIAGLPAGGGVELAAARDVDQDDKLVAVEQEACEVSGSAADDEERWTAAETGSPEWEAVVDFCHVLLNSNDFLYTH